MKDLKSAMRQVMRSEHDEQADLFAWAELASRQYPALSLMFAIPNFSGHHGSKVSRIVSGKRAKDEGRKVGVPDIMLPVARGTKHGLFMEMKRVDGRPSAVSHEQLAWHLALIAEGYRVYVCYGFEQARTAILEYLNLKSP